MTNPLLLGYETHDLIQDDRQFQKFEAVATFHVMVGAQLNMISIIKVMMH
jgi:hypothetical protein